MKILPLFIMLACIAWSARAQDEERAAPARGLLKRGPLVKGKTTTTTPPPQEDAEYEEEEGDYPAEGEAQESSTEAPATSTTEGKKLVGSGVRPFRSNTELLEILKRKRAQAAEAKLSGASASQTQDSGAAEAAKSNYNNKSKKRFNNAPVTREANNEDAPAPAPPAPAKPTRGRFAATRSVEPEEEQSDAAPPARNVRNFRRGGN